ncbi:MAG TPA: redox-regulated ATPase YchF [Syntrophobacteria bacterium]|nr:redox-regulated ATPase YchF [Syntrophobacteria bacterium]
MRLGIIGLPGCGKTTVFNALTGSSVPTGDFSGGERGPNLAVVKVPEPRLAFLAQLHKPHKVTQVTVEYVDMGGLSGSADPEHELGESFLTAIRPVDALVHVVRNFHHPLHGPAHPAGDVQRVETDLILSDLIVIEKRLERIAADRKRGKREDFQELQLLEGCRRTLEESRALRTETTLAEAPALRGYSFLSAKPVLVLINQPEEGAPESPLEQSVRTRVSVLKIMAKLEMELGQLAPEEAVEFIADLGVKTMARDRVIVASYELLNLISFFTANDREVRAWTVKAGATAIKAAGVVHSDMERGFIRAEVIAFHDLQQAGSYAAAQKKGLVRLEGKDYIVRDGDVIFFRFHV